MILAITPSSSINLSLVERARILTAAVSHGESSLEAILDFTEEKFVNILALNSTLFNSILSSVAPQIGSERLFNRFTDVAKMILEKGGISQSDYNSYESRARGNLEWQELFMKPIEEFFSFSETTTTTVSTTTLGASGIIASGILLTICLIFKYIF